MAPRSFSSFAKRQKERARQEKQQAKMQKRQGKAERPIPGAEGSPDSDLAPNDLMPNDVMDTETPAEEA